MVLMSAAPRSLRASPVRSVTAGRLSPAVIVALGTLVSFALSWPHLQTVWSTGTFFDTDDAMRMVQVRAWLDGQAWFDLAAHRLGSPAGLVMHWSRVVDVPLGLLIRLFALFTDRATAELLTRIVFPLALQGALIAATVFTAGVLIGPGSALPAMLLAVGSCFQFSQFTPGRIDHHAPQIVLLMLMAGFMADTLLRGRTRSARLAALCIAGSMAISLENLPFIALVIAAMGLSWAMEGSDRSAPVRAFGLALSGFPIAFYVATVAPARLIVVTPDAFSLPHLLAAVFGGLALALLGSVSPRLETVPHRLAALAASGFIVGVAVLVACPGCLTSPYAGIDPVVRTVWLTRVTEALPLATVVGLHPQALTLVVAPLLAGLLAMAVMAVIEGGRARGAWLLLGLMTAVGLAASCWEVRVVSSTTPLALLGGVGAFAALTRGTASGIRRLSAAALLLVCAPVAWIVVPVPEETNAVGAAANAAAACRAAGNVTPLDTLGTGLVVAPIDAGSHLLVHTHLAVLGAPYHRNNTGNRAVIDALSADPVAAEAIVRRAGARYVALCPGQVQAAALVERNPNGLAAQLLAGNPPAWLRPVAVPGTSYAVFAVR